MQPSNEVIHRPWRGPLMPVPTHIEGCMVLSAIRLAADPDGPQHHWVLVVEDNGRFALRGGILGGYIVWEVTYDRAYLPDPDAGIYGIRDYGDAVAQMYTRATTPHHNHPST